MGKNWKVDFHSHTNASRDSLARVDQVLQAARNAGLDRLVITDHNTLRGAREAQRIDPELVIVGEEILTLEGELLACFVKEEVPARLPPEDAIRLLRAQGAFISVSHPFDRRRHGWRKEDLVRIAPLVDAVEVFNARSQLPFLNSWAGDFARQHDLPGTAGSDAHTPGEVGRGTLLLPEFHDAGELRRVIRQGQVEGHLSSPFIHITSTYAKIRNFRF